MNPRKQRPAVGGGLAAAVLLTALVTGCSTTSAPQTDDEKINVLYHKFYSALSDRNPDAMLQVVCPGLRTSINTDAWFDDVSKLLKPGTTTPSSDFTPPDGGLAAPTATQWRRMAYQDNDPSKYGIRIAKIDSDWYVCEK